MSQISVPNKIAPLIGQIGKSCSPSRMTSEWTICATYVGVSSILRCTHTTTALHILPSRNFLQFAMENPPFTSRILPAPREVGSQLLGKRRGDGVLQNE